jgi:hypothetical protein
MASSSRAFLALLILGLAAAPQAGAEQLKSKLGFYVDMPAGFELKDGDGQAKFSFADPGDSMEYDLIAYAPGRYADVKALSADCLGKLGSKGDTSPFLYEGRSAIFAELAFGSGNDAMKGYAIFIEGRKSKGGKGAPDEHSYALLAYAWEKDLEADTDFILSCLDAFSIDRAARRSPGPVSQFTLEWPPARDRAKLVALPASSAPSAGSGPNANSAKLPWSEREAEQEAETDQREYKVLTAYANEQELWQDAWARFYRMAYRESAARLDQLALEVSRLLPADDPTEAARRVLAWVQLFVYERDEKGMDFVPPLASAYEARGDCDSRSVVAAIVLERLGIDAILMVSHEYSHAMLGVDVPGGGQRFEFNGKKYLVGETTAKVGIGLIAADKADWGKWMGINLGD